MASRDDRANGPFSIAGFRLVISNFPSPIRDLRLVIQFLSLFFARHSPLITHHCFCHRANENPPTRQFGSSPHPAPPITDMGKCVTRGFSCRRCPPFHPRGPSRKGLLGNSCVENKGFMVQETAKHLVSGRVSSPNAVHLSERIGNLNLLPSPLWGRGFYERGCQEKKLLR